MQQANATGRRRAGHARFGGQPRRLGMVPDGGSAAACPPPCHRPTRIASRWWGCGLSQTPVTGAANGSPPGRPPRVPKAPDKAVRRLQPQIIRPSGAAVGVVAQGGNWYNFACSTDSRPHLSPSGNCGSCFGDGRLVDFWLVNSSRFLEVEFLWLGRFTWGTSPGPPRLRISKRCLPPTVPFGAPR